VPLLLAALLVAGCTTPSVQAAPELHQLRVEVLAVHPHDPDAFTQGLELHDGLLYESTGRYGQSDLRVVDPTTGHVQHQVRLPVTFFGEGLTLVDDRIWQLTWREGVAIEWDRERLVERSRVNYSGEGWGICYDQPRDRLVMSDGSATLTFRDPDTFAATGSVTVTRSGTAQHMLNELECVGDHVYANVWQTDEIVRIDLATGRVDAVVDASGLLPAHQRRTADVLNGIAAVPGTDTFLITGKLWPSLFEVRFVPDE
jgi:glutamine cyclotransferase